nr:hypothetical protein CFP56_13760 [Quercus suber]
MTNPSGVNEQNKIIKAKWVKILAGHGFARCGLVVLVVCSPWVSRGFARRGSVVGLLAVGLSWVCSLGFLAVGLGLLAVGLSWVCSSWVSLGFARRGSRFARRGSGFARRGYGFCLLWVCSSSPLAPTPLALLLDPSITQSSSTSLSISVSPFLVLRMKFMEF